MLTDCPHCCKPMREEASVCPHCAAEVEKASGNTRRNSIVDLADMLIKLGTWTVIFSIAFFAILSELDLASAWR